MPVYKHKITGKLSNHSEDYNKLFEEGTFELIAPESVAEERQRLQREAEIDKAVVEISDSEESTNG